MAASRHSVIRHTTPRTVLLVVRSKDHKLVLVRTEDRRAPGQRQMSRRIGPKRDAVQRRIVQQVAINC